MTTCQGSSTRDVGKMSGDDGITVAQVEELRGQVFAKLYLLGEAELTEICAELQIAIPAEKAGVKPALFNLIVTFLTSDDFQNDLDNAFRILTELQKSLDKKLNISTVKLEPKDKDGGKTILRNQKVDDKEGEHSQSNSSVETPSTLETPEVEQVNQINSRNTNSCNGGSFPRMVASGGGPSPIRPRNLYRVHREFKIVGGTLGGEGQLEFSEVSFQITEGLAIGYSDREVISGVIKAMKPGCSLRKYCESRRNLTYSSLISILRSHYGVKDSQDLIAEMRMMKQEPKEKVGDFVKRVMAMRNTIIEVAQNEEHQIDIAMVKKACFHAISVGLRRDTIRLELRHILTNISLDDDEVLKEVSLAAARDREHLDRQNPRGAGGADACSLNTEYRDVAEISQVNAARENSILDRIERQLTAHVSEMQAVRSRMDQFERQLQGRPVQPIPPQIPPPGGNGAANGGNNNRNTRRTNFRNFIRCEACEQNRQFCTHCSKCGAADHKRKDCTEN